MTTNQISADDPDFGFEADPPSSEEIAVGHRVAFIIGLLEQAGRGQHVAWALSEALASLARGPASAISPGQAQALKDAALRAELAAMRLLPAIYSREGIRTGMWAMGLQIARWGGDSAALKHLSPGAARDINLYARIFRNDCHSMSIGEELRERAAKRQAEAQERLRRQTAAIIRDALEHVPQFIPPDGADTRGDVNG
ncbi:hypothetical protein ACQKLX_10020 [Bosea sp. NPDC003192]|uniref:hypothetical protein n=1 Tax=Bosea sp. NPDC003192 TaxID=3390551 RepID=UPI003D04E908